MKRGLMKKILLTGALSLVLALPAFATAIQNTDKTYVEAATATKKIDSADDVDYYNYSGKKVANWGTREEDCTFLTTYATSYYTGSYQYSTLSSYAGGSGQSDAPNSTLYKQLKSMMTAKHTTQTSYDATEEMYRYTDCEENDTAHISSFYSGGQINGSWGSSPSWNREHTWPKSKSLNGSAKGGKDEDDIVMLRPTLKSENSSRGNTAYGQSSGYYNPNSEAGGKLDLRGDCARICLYVYVRWGNTSYMWGSSGVMESLSVLLRWMQEDPVDTWEMGRNDAVQTITGVRNVFVDYPEFAWELFGQSTPKVSTPSGIAMSGVQGGNGGGSSADSSKDEESASSSSSSSSSSKEEDSSSSEVIPNGEKAVFTLGQNGDTLHFDGAPKSDYTETVNGVTLKITDGSQFYTGARDAKGNSTIKMGSSDSKGSFKLAVPNGVESVIFSVAGYKANAGKFTVNGKDYTPTGRSNDGVYTDIVIDTTSVSMLQCDSGSGTGRIMINTITFIFAEAEEDSSEIDSAIEESSEEISSEEESSEEISSTPESSEEISSKEDSSIEEESSEEVSSKEDSSIVEESSEEDVVGPTESVESTESSSEAEEESSKETQDPDAKKEGCGVVGFGGGSGFNGPFIGSLLLMLIGVHLIRRRTSAQE